MVVVVGLQLVVRGRTWGVGWRRRGRGQAQIAVKVEVVFVSVT